MGRPPTRPTCWPRWARGVKDAPKGSMGWAHWPRVPKGPCSQWLVAPLAPLPSAAGWRPCWHGRRKVRTHRPCYEQLNTVGQRAQFAPLPPKGKLTAVGKDQDQSQCQSIDCIALLAPLQLTLRKIAGVDQDLSQDNQQIARDMSTQLNILLMTGATAVFYSGASGGCQGVSSSESMTLRRLHCAACLTVI